MKRNIYLETMPSAEAVQKTIRALNREALVHEELIASHEASNRVLSQGIRARYSSPAFPSAAMDGYAVKAQETFLAREGFPIRLKQREQGCAFAVNTGNPLPEGCDAVIMIEQIVQDGEEIQIESPAYPWQHVRRVGEDIVATELLFPRNHHVRAWDVGVLLSGGVWEVAVWERIRVGIIPTGDEVLDFTTHPEPKSGQIIESNSQMLAALARELDCEVTCVRPVRDDEQALHQALESSLAAGNHITLFCAGSSAGSKDFTRSTIEKAGSIVVHGIATMPGKPSILGICAGRLVAGVPGYPVSALVSFKELLEPLIRWLSCREHPDLTSVPVELTRSVPSRLGVEEHIRVSIGRVGEKRVAIPLSRGAGNLSSVSRAQGVIRIPASVEGVAEGSMIQAELAVPEQELNQILVCTGSHDSTLDLIADELMGHTAQTLWHPVRLVSSHVGSMGGISALRSGSCHMSGMHLFDAQTKTFNFPFLRRFLSDVDVTVINLSLREQGFIVQPGNPFKIVGIGDLQRVRFINRQRGSGTRVLLDWHLEQAGILAANIRGYEREEVTHMGVAVQVLTGTADCGMGIYAAAKSLGLDFVPLTQERYDLVIPSRFLNDSRIVILRRILESETFKERIAAQGGYTTSLTGQILTS